MAAAAINWWRLGAISGGIAVALGAFGAHGLKPLLDAYQVGIYEKAVHYQFFHTLAILACVLLMQKNPDNKQLLWAARLFGFGILCFSGSLYLLATRHLLPVPLGWVGPVTPIGGVSFIGGWVLLALAAGKQKA